MLIFEIIYSLTSLLLAVYGFNSLYLLWLYHRSPSKQLSPPIPQDWPAVTVQLPIYNELHTVERLINAVNHLDYPREKLEIQVLDDSTDGTTALAASLVSKLRANGLNIVHLHRKDREGFKAGALAAGLHQAQGEFIAIFDADFVPNSSYLQRSIPWFHDQRVGCVQARWDHLNRDYSLLTRLQALAIDGHFTIEQTARSQNNLFLNFNGTAGIWRRTCILDAGGWSHDTLTEDLDLSYRAQLKGWKIAYIHDLSVPAELPAQITALKQQQSRWAKGSMQTACKLLIPLIKSSFPLRNKIEGTLHLTHYIVHPLILGALLLSLPMSFSFSPLMKLIPLLMLAAVGPPLLYLTAGVPGGPDFLGRLKLLPGLVLIGIGLSLSNSQAVLSGLLLSERGTFSRTPKFALQKREDRWEHSLYALRQDTWMWVEFTLLIFTCIVLSIAFANRLWGFISWLVLYLGSFLYVGSVALLQNYIQRRGPRLSRKKEPSPKKKPGWITHPPD